MAATHQWRVFFSNNYDGNENISFQDLHSPRGVIKKIPIKLYRTYERGLVIIDMTMPCDISISMFFLN